MEALHLQDKALTCLKLQNNLYRTRPHPTHTFHVCLFGIRLLALARYVIHYQQTIESVKLALRTRMFNKHREFYATSFAVAIVAYLLKLELLFIVVPFR